MSDLLDATLVWLKWPSSWDRSSEGGAIWHAGSLGICAGLRRWLLHLL